MFSFFLAGAPRAGEAPPVDGDTHLEALAVVGPLLVEGLIIRGSPEHLLGVLLQRGFEVLLRVGLRHLVDVPGDVLEDKPPDLFQTPASRKPMAA